MHFILHSNKSKNVKKLKEIYKAFFFFLIYTTLINFCSDCMKDAFKIVQVQFIAIFNYTMHSYKKDQPLILITLKIFEIPSECLESLHYSKRNTKVEELNFRSLVQDDFTLQFRNQGEKRTQNTSQQVIHGLRVIYIQNICRISRKNE